MQDLVNRGLVPGRTLQPAPQSRDDIVRDLVDRGLVPRSGTERLRTTMLRWALDQPAEAHASPT